MFNHITLKLLLIENELSVSSFAKKVGVTITTASHWINGKHEPSQDKLPALSKLFKIKQGEFLK